MSTLKPATELSQARIAWLFNCIGTPDSLLYWNEILPRYLERFPNSDFWTARPPAKLIPGTAKSVQFAGSWRIPLGKRSGSYERQLVLPAPQIIRRLQRIAPDLIIVQELLAYAIYLALFRPFFRSTKILLLLESDPIRYIPARRNRWVTLIRRLTAKRMDWCLTNNRAGQAYLSNVLGIPSERIIVKPYLVSQPPQPAETNSQEAVYGCLPKAAQSDRGKVIFLFVGQLIERKGVTQLVEAVSRLSPETLDQTRFWLVGDGPQRAALENLVIHYNLQRCIRFLGPQPYEKLGNFYRAASCFIMPTLDDYRALVGFEALAYGLPLLHSRYDGASVELVTAGQNGYIIDPRNTSEFADDIQRMVTQKDELRYMGEQSALRSAQNFTLQHAVENLATAIHQVLTTAPLS